MTHYNYKAYGLTWQMPMACPELTTCADEQPDVIVSFGFVPDIGNVLNNDGPMRYVTSNVCIFHIPEVASFHVLNGREIVIQPEPEAKDDEVRLCLLGRGIACILHQWGVIPIHASSIRTQRGAVLFAGHSGVGKSTLLAAFIERDYAMLADDITAVRIDMHNTPLVIPGYPQIKLWADSAHELDRSLDGLRRVHHQFEKYAVPVVEGEDTEPVRLYAIYVLQPEEQSELCIESLKVDEKFKVLFENTRLSSNLMQMERHVDHFKMATSLANQVHVCRVKRPIKPFLLSELVDLIEQDFIHMK